MDDQMRKFAEELDLKFSKQDAKFEDASDDDPRVGAPISTFEGFSGFPVNPREIDGTPWEESDL